MWLSAARDPGKSPAALAGYQAVVVGEVNVFEIGAHHIGPVAGHLVPIEGMERVEHQLDIARVDRPHHLDRVVGRLDQIEVALGRLDHHLEPVGRGFPGHACASASRSTARIGSRRSKDVPPGDVDHRPASPRRAQFHHPLVLAERVGSLAGVRGPGLFPAAPPGAGSMADTANPEDSSARPIQSPRRSRVT